MARWVRHLDIGEAMRVVADGVGCTFRVSGCRVERRTVRPRDRDTGVESLQWLTSDYDVYYVHNIPSLTGIPPSLITFEFLFFLASFCPSQPAILPAISIRASLLSCHLYSPRLLHPSAMPLRNQNRQSSWSCHHPRGPSIRVNGRMIANQK